MQTGQFEVMDINTDEDEHSIEMHLPYVAKVMERYMYRAQGMMEGMNGLTLILMSLCFVWRNISF